MDTIFTGRRGGQKLDINKRNLEHLLSAGFSVSSIANDGLLGAKVHRNTISNFMASEGIPKPRQRFSTILDAEMHDKVRAVHNDFPKSGYREVKSILEGQNAGVTYQRERVRLALKAVDPVGTEERWRKAIKRRVYSVPTPNYLWHMDTNHKLILWNFVVHGCVDGYSRLQMHLQVTTDNLALTGLNIFINSVREYGVPSRIRADGGKEFNHIEKFMDAMAGTGKFLRGKSVHNVRVERLWRDTREKVLDKYKYIFMHMEENNVLDVNNDIHMFCLHYVFKPRINADLEVWKGSWNRHGLRTMRYKSPTQLWYSGALANQNQNYSAMSNIFQTNRDDRNQAIDNFMSENSFDEPADISIVLSRIPPPLTDAELQELQGRIDPLALSGSGGIDLYGQTVAFVSRCCAR